MLDKVYWRKKEKTDRVSESKALLMEKTGWKTEKELVLQNTKRKRICKLCWFFLEGVGISGLAVDRHVVKIVKV